MVIIDDTYKELKEVYRGRKPKVGLIKDGQKYIFKYGSINNEIIAELLSEQIGLQAGIEMAHYIYAKKDNQVGVLTTNFLQNGEVIIHSDKLKTAVSEIYKDNNLDFDISVNSISNLIDCITFYDREMDITKLRLELIKRWCFYLLIFESDKNETNISFIKKLNGSGRIAPDYDNSSMCQLNKNISSMIDNFKRGSNIYDYMDKIKCQFKFLNDIDDSFYTQFTAACMDYPEEVGIILQEFSNINVYEAINKVEKINNITIPYDISFWCNKLITSRLNDMKSIYNNINKRKVR